MDHLSLQPTNNTINNIIKHFIGQIYACTQNPRHMSSSLDTFRFTLPYYGLFGGAVAIESDVFVHVNGMSNMFQGWGNFQSKIIVNSI